MRRWSAWTIAVGQMLTATAQASLITAGRIRIGDADPEQLAFELNA